jgi:hypothetical protein
MSFADWLPLIVFGLFFLFIGSVIYSIVEQEQEASIVEYHDFKLRAERHPEYASRIRYYLSDNKISKREFRQFMKYCESPQDLHDLKVKYE